MESIWNQEDFQDSGHITIKEIHSVMGYMWNLCWTSSVLLFICPGMDIYRDAGKIGCAQELKLKMPRQAMGQCGIKKIAIIKPTYPQLPPSAVVLHTVLALRPGDPGSRQCSG